MPPPILTERVTWKKPRPPNETRRSSDLTPEEQENVRTALKVLRIRFGGWERLGVAMRAKRQIVRHAAFTKKPSAGIALRAARLAGVPLEDILSGRWPQKGACPMCGHVRPALELEARK